jgi:two-component system capsular synthesis sensor histidine kinase RcsC
MQTSEAPAPALPDAAPHRLLIVDDEGAILFGFADYFRSHGFVVDTASEVEEAQALLAHGRYDVVVSDLRLLGLSAVEGLDVLASAGAARPRPYTVLISAYLTAEAEREARKRGIDRVMRKPVPLAVLERALRELLRGEQ